MTILTLEQIPDRSELGCTMHILNTQINLLDLRFSRILICFVHNFFVISADALL